MGTPIKVHSVLTETNQGVNPTKVGFFWVYRTNTSAREIGYFDGNYWKFVGAQVVTAQPTVFDWGMLPEYMHGAEKSLRTIQKEIGEWSKRNFGKNVSKTTSQEMGSGNALLGIGEEYGELCHVVLKRHQGIRGYDNDEKYITERDDAIADILVYLSDFAFREGVDLLANLNEVWDKVCKRDWEKNKVDAHEVAELPPIGSQEAKELLRQGNKILNSNIQEREDDEYSRQGTRGTPRRQD